MGVCNLAEGKACKENLDQAGGGGRKEQGTLHSCQDCQVKDGSFICRIQSGMSRPPAGDAHITPGTNAPIMRAA